MCIKTPSRYDAWMRWQFTLPLLLALTITACAPEDTQAPPSTPEDTQADDSEISPPPSNDTDSPPAPDTTGAPDSTPPPTQDEIAPSWSATAALTVGSLSPTSLQLLWTGATDNVGVSAYRLYRDNDLIQTLPQDQANVGNLTPETTYTFRVQAGDAAGNWSTNGPSLTLTTSAAITAWDNATVYELLKPTCVACHDSSSPSAPFFASITAFENGLVFNPAYVIPGDPEASPLVHLLAGTATGGFTQMPLGTPSFAALAEAGSTLIGLQDIKDWIAGLDAGPTGPVEEPITGPFNTRLRAEDILRSLYDHLGLVNEDFWGWGSFYGDVNGDCISGPKGDRFPIRSPDAHPGACSNSQVYGKATSRFIALGGPSWRERVQRNNGISPTFLLHLTQTVQAHCRLAFTKNGNTAVLQYAGLNDPSSTSAAAIRDNIAYLHLRFLGEVASNAQIDLLFTLFQTYEAGVEVGMSSHDRSVAAWTSVCATLLRDPLWITH